jgi:hypothetical protein
MKSILDPSFRYTASFDTDLRKTFARIRRDDRNGAAAVPHAGAEPPVKTAPTGRKTASGRQR